MFDYTDPTGSGLLDSTGAITNYRQQLESFYDSFSQIQNTTFQKIESVNPSLPSSRVDTIPWIAFPRTNLANDDRQIDRQRIRWQDEYVEWDVDRTGRRIDRITFTTEFVEYYQALAKVSRAALLDGIRDAIPGANPTNVELFGSNFNPANATPDARARRFRERATVTQSSTTVPNPWNSGRKGILCLSHRNNTLGALFNLVSRCAVPRIGAAPSDTCDLVGGACGAGRNSDPIVCTAAQNAAREPRDLTLVDPVGVKIIELRGIWKINGTQIDINDPSANQGAWTVSRNGRRGVLDLTSGLTLGDSHVRSGTEVSRQLVVGVDVLSSKKTSAAGMGIGLIDRVSSDGT